MADQTPEAAQFDVIYADPPWRYDFSKSDSRGQDTLRAQAIADAQRQALEDARKRAEEEQRLRAQHAGDRRLTAEERQRLDLLDRLENVAGYRLDSFTFGDEEDTKVTPERLAAAIGICRAAGDLGQLPRFQRDQLVRALDQARAGVDVLAQAIDEWGAVSGERRR